MTSNDHLASIAAELRRAVGADVRFGPTETRKWSRDFGRLHRRAPGIVVLADSEATVCRTVRLARAHGLGVTLQGGAHSCRGQSLGDGGILIANMARGAPGPRLLDDARVEVSARSRWRDVERRLHRSARAIPVLADYLDLSVGGTLSVGVYGVGSVRHGPLVDQVDRLRVITADGAAVWCSPSELPDLFRFTLAGFGRLAIIEKAIVRTVPHEAFTTLFSYSHQSLEEMVESFAWLLETRAEDGPGFFKALGSRGRFLSFYGVDSGSRRQARGATPPAELSSMRLRRRQVLHSYRWWRSLAVTAWTGRFAGRFKIWSDYLLDFPGLQAFVSELSALLDTDAFAGCLKSIYVVATRRNPGRTRLPLEAASSIQAPLRFGIGLYSMVPRRDDATLRAVQAASSRCLDKCVELGGRPYLYGWHELDRATVRRLYGVDYQRLVELKEELDPDATFPPVDLVFRG